ncbi:hypothetical protein ACVYAP_13920, partial [Acinetobacter baumannii]
FWCRLIHLKIILWNKPLEIGLCNKAIPIRNALEKADQIETEQKRTKKINFMLTVVGLISFALSIGGLYVSLKSPSKEDIASIMKNELQNIKKVQ